MDGISFNELDIFERNSLDDGLKTPWVAAPLEKFQKIGQKHFLILLDCQPPLITVVLMLFIFC